MNTIAAATTEFTDAGEQLKEQAVRHLMMLVSDMCVKFANFSAPEEIVPEDEAAYNAAKQAVEDKIRALLGTGTPVGRLCVFADKSSETGSVYDISGTMPQHSVLEKHDGALLYLEPQTRSSFEDTRRLDFLESQAAPGLNWACRKSATDRGYRLHQGHDKDFKTAREAIDGAMSQGCDQGKRNSWRNDSGC